MAVVFALLAALSNAASVSTQHIASTAGPRRSSGWRVVLYLFHNPLWLFGWVALAGAFLFQALALHDGLVSVVQPLLVTVWRSRSCCAGSGSISPSAGSPGRRCSDLRWPGRVHRRRGTRRRPSHPDKPALDRRVSDLRRRAAVLAALAQRGSPACARPCTPRRPRSSGARGNRDQGHDDTPPSRRGRNVHALAGVRPGRRGCRRHLLAASGASRRAAAGLPAISGDR